ncbi:MAG: alpha/beta fold hydrolase [Anaerolineae bacterium]
MTDDDQSLNTLNTQLRAFQQRAQLEQIQLDAHSWTCYTLGNPDDEALLILAGGGADAEVIFQYITHLSRHFYVIAPNLPPTLNTLSEALDGLRALLAHHQRQQAVVVGLAFGAMLAQAYIRRFQDSVTDLIITHSWIPSQHLAEAMAMQQQLLQLTPEPLLLWRNRRAYQRDIASSSTPADPATRRFWQDYFEQHYSERIRKAHLLSRARLMAEYHAENEFNSRDLLHWHGDLLLIESDADQVISEGDRGSLKAMYNRAYIQTLYGYDHLAPLLAANELSQSIINFLLKET